MAELEWEANPKRPALRRAVRHQLSTLDRPFRAVAENFLAADSRIDLLGVGGEGELVSLRIANEGEDAEMLTRLLSDLVWMRTRTEDFLKLVPTLGIRPTAETRAVLLCPEFQIETRTAIQSLGAGQITLLRYSCYRLRGQFGVTLEPVRPRSAAQPGVPQTTGPAPPPGDGAETARPARGFRTGLNDADLTTH